MFKPGNIYRFRQGTYQELFQSISKKLAEAIGEFWFEVVKTDAYGNVLSLIIFVEDKKLFWDQGVGDAQMDRFLIGHDEIGYFFDGGPLLMVGLPPLAPQPGKDVSAHDDRPDADIVPKKFAVIVDYVVVHTVSSFSEAQERATKAKKESPGKLVEIYTLRSTAKLVSNVIFD
ncbi:hypothetical protein MOO17_12485 [Escherichia coli]|uniref:hypothetical protein n=1 Tax=Escherichia coli TaxID=562 RepID=UPI001FF13033|nr:hypothetical protein [Escherichia coli]MCJ8478840.1 hypothetical protein [Escherichia coli]